MVYYMVGMGGGDEMRVEAYAYMYVRYMYEHIFEVSSPHASQEEGCSIITTKLWCSLLTYTFWPCRTGNAASSCCSPQWRGPSSTPQPLPTSTTPTLTNPRGLLSLHWSCTSNENFFVAWRNEKPWQPDITSFPPLCWSWRLFPLPARQSPLDWTLAVPTQHYPLKCLVAFFEWIIYICLGGS